MNGVNDHGKLVDGRVDSSPSRDTLLLLPSGISGSRIESWVRKLDEVCQVLVNAANDQGGHDNITVLVAKLGSLPEILEMTQPTALNRETHGLSIGTNACRKIFW